MSAEPVKLIMVVVRSNSGTSPFGSKSTTFSGAERTGLGGDRVNTYKG